SLTPVLKEAQIPRFADGEHAPVGMSRLPSLCRLDRGVQGRLDSKIGIDLLDSHALRPLKLPRVAHRQNSSTRFNTLNAIRSERDLDWHPGRRAGFLQLNGWADQGSVQEDVAPAPGDTEPALTDLDLPPRSRTCALRIHQNEPILDLCPRPS